MTHQTRVQRVAARKNSRGYFGPHWVARCACGWRGKGRPVRSEAFNDAQEHRDRAWAAAERASARGAAAPDDVEDLDDGAGTDEDGDHSPGGIPVGSQIRAGSGSVKGAERRSGPLTGPGSAPFSETGMPPTTHTGDVGRINVKEQLLEAQQLGHELSVEEKHFPEHNAPPKFWLICSCGYRSTAKRSKKALAGTITWHLGKVLGEADAQAAEIQRNGGFLRHPRHAG